MDMDMMRDMVAEMDFPASKQEMMEQAREKGHEEHMGMLKNLPDKNYGNMQEVMDEMKGMGDGADMEDM